MQEGFVAARVTAGEVSRVELAVHDTVRLGAQPCNDTGLEGFLTAHGISLTVQEVGFRDLLTLVAFRLERLDGLDVLAY